MSHTATVVVTKFGRISLTPTSATHVYATTNPGGGRVDQLLPWTIRGKEHKFITAHLYRWSDGQFHIGEEKDSLASYHGLYATSLSDAARKTVVPVLESAVNNFANDTPSAFRDAAIEDLNDKIDRLETERAELVAKAHKVTDEITALRATREALTGTR
jgi:hypothetical protein